MGDLLQDFRYGSRVLARNRGFAVTAVLILSLSTGAVATIFSVVNAMLFRPLPYKDADRITFVLGGKERLQNWGPVSAADFSDWKNQNRVFEEMAIFSPESVNLSGGSDPERISAARVASELMPLLGIQPSLGRSFLAEEHAPGQNRVVLLSQGLWKRRFGSNPDLAGSSLTIDGAAHRVAGVLPQGLKLVFIMGFEPDVLLPLLPNASENRGLRQYGAIGRLAPGVSLGRAGAELAAIAGRLQQRHPETNAGWTVRVDTLRGTVDPLAYILLVVLVGSVVGIACTNVANLLLARGSARDKEIAVRSALGASRMRLARQLITESLLLSFAGCFLGIILSFWACRLITTYAAGTNAGMLELGIDGRVVGCVLLLFLLTSVSVGLVPALQVSRGNPNETLRQAGLSSQSAPARRRLRNALVISEIALSLLLLMGAGLAIKSWLRLWQVDPGFRPQGVLTLALALPDAEFSEQAQVAFVQELLDRLANRTYAQSAAVTSAPPTMGTSRPFTIEERPKPAPGEEPAARITIASPGYFSTLAIPLKKGRGFTVEDTANAMQIAVINEAMARRFWGDGDPVGSRIRMNGDVRTIVGVAGDVRSVPLGLKPYPDIYVPFLQSPTGRMVLVVRASGSNPGAIAADIKKEVQAMQPGQPASQFRTMEEVMSGNLGVIRLGTSLLGIVAVGSLVLAAIGLYGVMAYAVSRRTGEIGIRMALGARAVDVMKMILGQGLALVLLAVVPGIAGSLALGRLLANRIYGVSPVEPAILGGALLLIVAVSLGACYVPARRATHVDPITALRSE